MSAKRGIYLAPFDELADAALVADLALEAESHGWDGFFVWDHVAYRPPVRAVADPWVCLAAVASVTERIRIGAMVTPLSRRRVQKVARETVTLDRLSEGRLVFGVGLGSDRNGELEPFGEVTDPRERARLLDDGLERLAGLWAGGFEPAPLQKPRIPVWVAGRWPNRRPLRRAARWDGVFPIDLGSPDDLAELVAEVGRLREGADGPYDVVVDDDTDDGDPGPWEDAGATWWLKGFGRQPREAAVRERILAGP